MGQEARCYDGNGLCSTGANDEGGGEAHCNDGRGQISSGQKMEGMRHAVMTEVGLCSSGQMMKGGRSTL